MKKLWYAVQHYARSTDRWLLALWGSASGASMLFLYGIYNSGLGGSRLLYAQAGTIGMGLVCAIILSKIDYNSLLKLWKLYLPAGILLVLLTFTALGVTRGGDRAWLAIGGEDGFTIQPSEFLKISFITTFALHLDKVQEELNRPLNVLLLCLHGGVHVLLIQLQGDGGSALIFLIIFAVMIFCAGLGWRYLAAAAASAAAALPLLWLRIMTEDQKMRVLIILNPELDPDFAYQQARAAAALGTGGLQGTGLLHGDHVSVPEIYNDFIIAFIGEALGFMGCLGVILLLCAISLKILYNSSIAKDAVGRYLCIGVFAMLIGQIFINLGMSIGLLPVIGVTLPLISSGGTSVLSFYLGLGLVLSVYMHSKTSLFQEK